MNYLHTKSSYFDEISPGGLDKWNTGWDAYETAEHYLNLANKLQDLENSFFQQFQIEGFPCNNYENFIQMIRYVINSSQGDKIALQKFRKDTLTNVLRLWSTQLSNPFYAPRNANIKIVLNTKEYTNSIDQLFKVLQKKISTNSKTNLLTLDITGNIAEINIPKAYLSTDNISVLLYEIFNKSNTKNGKANSTSTQNVQSIEELTKELSANINNIITFSSEETNGQNVSVFQEYVNITNAPLWQYTKEQWLAAEADPNSNLYQELELVKQNIYVFLKQYIFNTASPELLDAFNELWTTQISTVFSHGRFFTRGRNFIDGVSGALGEFQSALLPIYLKHKTKSNPLVQPLLMDLLSEGGELDKSDVNLETALGIVGIQVKNISLNSKDIAVNIHPDKLPPALADYIINGIFNTDIGIDETLVQNELRKHIPEILHIAGMNLPLTFADLPTNSVSFYLVGGQFIVPASSLLKSYSAKILMSTSQMIKISTKFKGKSNDGYLEQDKEGDPYFWPYWRNSGSFENPIWIWVGEGEWENLNDDISISTNIKLSRLGNISNYSIFST